MPVAIAFAVVLALFLVMPALGSAGE